MNAQKRAIGLIVKQLAKEKNLSAIELAERMGISRQGVYEAFNKQNMSLDKIEQWATALEVTSKDILNLVQGDDNLKVDKPTVGDNYLMRYLAELEATVKELRETVRSQAHTIELLAGKSVSVPSVGLQSYFFTFASLGTLTHKSAYFFGVYLQ